MPPYTSPMMPAAINRIAAILSALTVPPFALEDAPAGDEPDDQDDDGDDEQDVDEAAHRVGGNHAEQPQYKQNDENRPEHFSPPVPPDLVLHVADEEFVVHALDAHRAGRDATRVVLDHLGADTADQRHYALRGTHIDVPRLDLGVGDQLHLDLRADHHVVDPAPDRPLADRQIVLHPAHAVRPPRDLPRLAPGLLRVHHAGQVHNPLPRLHVHLPRLHLVVGLQRRLDQRRDPRVRMQRLLRHHRGGAPGKRQYPDTHQRTRHHNQSALHETPSFSKRPSNLVLGSFIGKSAYYPGAGPVSYTHLR